MRVIGRTEDDPGTTPARGATAAWAYATTVWAVTFALVHVYWAAGGGWGLPKGFRVPDHVGLLVVDVVAVPLCLAGGAASASLVPGSLMAGSLVPGWGRRLPARLRLRAVLGMAAISLLHSTPTVVLAVVALVQHRAGTLPERTWISYYLYEPYWFLGGTLSAAAWWTGRRRVIPAT